jgi:hypothetical protein
VKYEKPGLLGFGSFLAGGVVLYSGDEFVDLKKLSNLP